MSPNTCGQILRLATLSVLVLHVCSTRESNKPGVLGTYCYQDFLAAWKECCGSRYPSCKAAALASVKMNQGKRKRRNALEGGPFQPWWMAKNFLSKRQRRSVNTAATEECCNEQCSLQEIAEYPCFSNS